MSKLNNWSCFPTAFAIVLGIDVKSIFEFCKHDGSEIIEPHLKEPFRRRGFHIQEIIDFVLSINKTVTPIEFCPSLAQENQIPHLVYDLEFGLQRIQKYLRENDGVVTGVSDVARHAYAIIDGKFIDPDDDKILAFPPDSMILDTFYIVK